MFLKVLTRCLAIFLIFLNLFQVAFAEDYFDLRVEDYDYNERDLQDYLEELYPEFDLSQPDFILLNIPLPDSQGISHISIKDSLDSNKTLVINNSRFSGKIKGLGYVYGNWFLAQAEHK